MRFVEHIGSVTQPSQTNTIKTVGAHFRTSGHAQSYMVFLTLEKAVNKDKFVLEARDQEIRKYDCVQTNLVHEIEHGLNLKWICKICYVFLITIIFCNPSDRFSDSGPLSVFDKTSTQLYLTKAM